MALAAFRLLGEEPNESQSVHQIEILAIDDLETLKLNVADSFSIVDPNGVGFQSSTGDLLNDIDDILAEVDTIAVTIDGHAVREIPEQRGLPFIGTYFQVFPDHLDNHQKLLQHMGPLIKHTDFGKTTYVTNDPTIASHALKETEFWSKQIGKDHAMYPLKNNLAGVFVSDTSSVHTHQVHKFLPPALVPKAVRHYMPHMQEVAEMSFKIFDQFEERGEAFNVIMHMSNIASEAIGMLAIGEHFGHLDQIDPSHHSLFTWMEEVLSLTRTLGTKPKWYQSLPFGDPARLRIVRKKFEDMVLHYVDKAAAAHEKDSTLPIATAALEADSIADYAARAIDAEGNRFPRENIPGAMSVVIGAGFTTTASAMSQMIYEMVQNPWMQDLLLQELVDHGVTQDTKWDYELATSLPYLNKFVNETLRLHSPSFQPTRMALRDQILPGGYKIPKGAMLNISPYHIHRNPEVWKDPTKFDPDRWDSEAKGKPKGSFIPFAMGPRSCIGLNFAQGEMKLMMSILVYRYEFKKYGDEIVEYDRDFPLVKPVNFYASTRRRTQWPARSQRVQ